MIRTIARAEDIPDSTRSLGLLFALVAAVFIALAWGGFFYVLHSTMESDRIIAAQPYGPAMATLDLTHIPIAPEFQPTPDQILPPDLVLRPLSQLASISLDMSAPVTQ